MVWNIQGDPPPLDPSDDADENKLNSMGCSSSDIFRGCYKDEWGVDPNKLGCHVQAGELYCFCKGDKCNNKVGRFAFVDKVRKWTCCSRETCQRKVNWVEGDGKMKQDETPARSKKSFSFTGCSGLWVKNSKQRKKQRRSEPTCTKHASDDIFVKNMCEVVFCLSHVFCFPRPALCGNTLHGGLESEKSDFVSSVAKCGNCPVNEKAVLFSILLVLWKNLWTLFPVSTAGLAEIAVKRTQADEKCSNFSSCDFIARG